MRIFCELRLNCDNTLWSYPSNVPTQTHLFATHEQPPAFGLTITNAVFLGLLSSDSAGAAVNQIYNTTNQVGEIQARYTHVELQQSMVFLWTVGSFLHSTFDMLIWYLAACACFRPGGIATNSRWCQKFGIYLAVLVVVGTVFAATMVVVMRLDGDEQNLEETMASQFADDYDNGDVAANTATYADTTEMIFSSEEHKFSFLIGYALELVFALFVYYFLTSTIFFSGVLGCGRVPLLGGRPYELRVAAKKAIKESKRHSRRSQSRDEEGCEVELCAA